MNEVKFKANIKDLAALLAALQAAVSEIPEIPTPATTDEGKVLTVSVDSSGETPVAEYVLAALASGLPAIASGDAGKVLTVNAGETGAEWASASGGGVLPTPTIDDVGAVLGVIIDEAGTPVQDTVVPSQEITISTGYVPFQNSAYAGQPLNYEYLTWYIVIDNVDHEMTYQNARLEYEASSVTYAIQVDTVTQSILEFCVEDDHSAVVAGTYNIGLKMEHLPVTWGIMWP